MKRFVITGTCGAGKSTVNDKLSATSPHRIQPVDGPDPEQIPAVYRHGERNAGQDRGQDRRFHRQTDGLMAKNNERIRFP